MQYFLYEHGQNLETHSSRILIFTLSLNKLTAVFTHLELYFSIGGGGGDWPRERPRETPTPQTAVSLSK